MMIQNSLVLVDHKALAESDFILIDSEHSSKSSFSKLSDDLRPAPAPIEETPSINYTINSPTSPNSQPKYSKKKSKLPKKGKKTFKFKTSLSINESFQDPIIDSRFNIADISAIECKSNLLSNSPENTNANNSFVNGEDMGLFATEGVMESGVITLKESILGFLVRSLDGIKRDISKINSILVDNLTIIWNVLRTCTEKNDIQKCLIRYMMHLFKENLLKNDGFVRILHIFQVGSLKERCEGLKGSEIAGLGLGAYGIKMELDLVKSSLREEAICFLFRVKNFEEKQNLMNVLMNTQ